MATTLYLRLGESAPAGITLPGVWEGGWVATPGILGKALDLTSGSSQLSEAINATGFTTYGIAQFCSAPLDMPSLAAGAWTVGFALSASNGNGYYGYIYIAVMKGDGSGVRGVVVARTILAAGAQAEATVYSASVSGLAVPSITAGDYLLVEVGSSNINGTMTLYADGSTPITATGVATSNAQSFVTCPTTLVFMPKITVAAAASAAASLTLVPITLVPLTLTASASAGASLGVRTGQLLSAVATASASVNLTAVTTNPPGPPMSIYATKIYLSVGDGMVLSGSDWVPSSGDYLDLTDGKKYLVLENGLSVPNPARSGLTTAGAVPRSGSVRSLPNRQVQLTMMIKGATQPNFLTPTQDSDTSIWAAWRAIEYKLEQARAASGPIGHGTNIVLMVRFPLSMIQGGKPAFTFFDVLDGEMSPVEGTNTGTYYKVTLTLSCLPFTRQGAITWPAVGAYAGPLTNDTASQVYLGPSVNGYQAATNYFYPGSPTAPYLGSTIPTGVPWYGSFVQDAAAYQYGTAFDGFAVGSGPPTQLGETFTHAGWTGAQAIRIGQYVTPLLGPKAVPAGGWVIGFGMSASSTGATWTPVVAITQYHAVSQSTTLLLDVTAVGAVGRVANGSEVTCYGTVSVPAFTLLAGDQLIVETGLILTGAGSAITAVFYGGGSTTISTDNTATNDAGSGITPPTAITWGYANSTVSGPIAGAAGAMAQIHVLDKSSAGAINRLRIGRRSVPGAQSGAAQGGIQPGDWVGVVNSTQALGSATYHTGQTNAVGGDYCSLLIANANANTWNDIARLTSEVGGVTPIYEQGIYDVWVRVRDSSGAVNTPEITTLVTRPLSGSDVLIPDQYTARITAMAAGGEYSDPSSPQSLLLPYTNWPPNIFYEGFETGNSNRWVTLQNSANSVGDLAVDNEAALVGQYGLRISLLYVNPNNQSPTTYVPPDTQQIVRGFSLPNNTDPIQLSFWMKIVGISGSSNLLLASVGSSQLAYLNSHTTTYGGTTVSADGPYLGNICWIGTKGGNLVIGGWSGHYATATSAQLGTFTMSEILNQPLYFTINMSTPSISSAGGTIVNCKVQGAGIAASAAISVTLAGSSISGGSICDQVFLGGATLGAASVGTIYYDDITLHQSASGIFPAPTNGIYLDGTEDTVYNTVYVQQGSGPWMQVPQVHLPATLSAAQIFGSGSGGTNPLFVNPPQANPQPCQIRGRLSVAGASANPIYTPAVETLIQNSQWHMVNLGTLPLPPLSTMEGLNPAGGSGNGGFAWQLDIQGLSPNSGAYGNNTLDIDAVWLFPHDEPQIVAEYAGMGNTTPAEWVIDTRRDGRTGALLRRASDQTTQVGSANTIGYLRLAPGNQDLLILAERDGGVHDVSNTAFSVQVRYQPQNHFLSDTSTVY